MITLADNIDSNGQHDVEIQNNGLIYYHLTDEPRQQSIMLYGTKEQWLELVEAIQSRIYQLKSIEPKKEGPA